ncbi:hypothetical protein QYF61_009920 [Mycteria americana]|uniref:Uncharacterized protein n=1 Tax=Mycteria americana TaxID=33587 RepID=A0AAN7RQC6_MYCAM|nr:hypothetical protein QYF61_009920 [Mycteria americana]
MSNLNFPSRSSTPSPRVLSLVTRERRSAPPLHCPPRKVQTAVRAPLSLLFSRLNKPSCVIIDRGGNIRQFSSMLLSKVFPLLIVMAILAILLMPLSHIRGEEGGKGNGKKRKGKEKVSFRVKQLFKNNIQRSTPVTGIVATQAPVTGTAVTPTLMTGTVATQTLATATAAEPENQPMPVSVTPIHKKKYTRKSAHLVRDEDEPGPS